LGELRSYLRDGGQKSGDKALKVFKLQGRRNRMEFIDGFPGVASAFKVKDLIYDGVARPHNGDDLEERQAIWDQRNLLALEKLQY